MRKKTLTKISENIKTLMLSKNKELSRQDLAKASGISYPTLTPILKGTRDFGVIKLVQLAEALGTTPNDIMKGAYSLSSQKNFNEIEQTGFVKLLAAFISVANLTYCVIENIETKERINSVLSVGFSCDTKPNQFINAIKNILFKFDQEIDTSQVAVFMSVQKHEYIVQRRAIINAAEKEFSTFILEADWHCNYRTFFKNKSGICITINEGSSIVYSVDSGENIYKIQGFGFPISDEGGDLWLGWQALKHAINVVEKVEASTTLSNRVLALFNSDLLTMSEALSSAPEKVYLQASTILKELAYKKQKSYGLIKKGFAKIISRVHAIDKNTGTKLPILISGELAYLYEELIPDDRRYEIKASHHEALQKYGIDSLKKVTKG